MKLTEYFQQETALTDSEKKEYQKLQELGGIEPDMTTDVSFNDWHDDAMLAQQMGLLKDDPNG